jgi:hypothetical protein
MITDSGASQVHHGIDPLEFLPLYSAESRVPLDLVVSRCSSNNSNHLVAFGAQSRNQCRSDQAR